MNARLKRLILPLLRAAKEGKPPTFGMKSAASQALFLIGKPSLKRKSANQQKKAGRAAARQARNLSTSEIREVVAARGGPCCENCGQGCVEAGLQMDHWLGGSGRRLQQQSVETCWMLCLICHNERTLYWPSVAHWNERFAIFCERNGYKFIPHIIHQPVSAAAGGSK